jgi:hypothetical protein
MEHRWGERIAVDIPIKLAVRPYSVRSAHLMNLSLSGAYIKTGFDMRLLARIQVVIELPLRFKHATPVISAYIARKLLDGCGVEWCEFAPQPVLELLRTKPCQHSDAAVPRPHEAGTPPEVAPSRAPRHLKRHGS